MARAGQVKRDVIAHYSMGCIRRHGVCHVKEGGWPMSLCGSKLDSGGIFWTARQVLAWFALPGNRVCKKCIAALKRPGTT